jgi:hypothetical protein
MRFFHCARITPHESPVEILRGRAHVLSNFSGQFKGTRENARRVRQDLVEQIPEVLGGRREYTTCTDEVTGIGEPDKTWQEIRRTGFHDYATPSEDEAILALLAGDPEEISL